MTDVTGHKPITKQRSNWEPLPDVPGDPTIPGIDSHWHRRAVNDGVLLALVAEEPLGWHMSISFRDRRREHTRYPTWDEQVHAVRALLPGDVTYVMAIPPEDEYVAMHDTTFHWHEYPTRPEAAVMGDALKLVSSMSAWAKGTDEADQDEVIGANVQALARSVHAWIGSMPS